MEMFCTPSERIEIGRRVFAHELANKEAAAEYGVAEQSIYQYVREYLKSAGLPPYSRMQLKCRHRGRSPWSWRIESGAFLLVDCLLEVEIFVFPPKGEPLLLDFLVFTHTEIT